MARDWPFFNGLLTDAQTALAIADLDIARSYSMLAGDLHDKFYPEIRAEYDLTVKHVLAIREQEGLLDKNATLRRSIRLRNPYVDPMSLLQVGLAAAGVPKAAITATYWMHCLLALTASHAAYRRPVEPS